MATGATPHLKNNKANDGEFKDVGLHMIANYSFNSNWSLVGNLGYKRLVGDAEDSPIVDDAGSADQIFSRCNRRIYFLILTNGKKTAIISKLVTL